MTLAERVFYERQHGSGSAPAPTKREPESLADLRKAVADDARSVDLKRAEVELKRVEVADAEKNANMMREELEQSRAERQSVAVDHSPAREETHRMPQRVQTDRKGMQHCVTPLFALKRFFTDWSIHGRSSRSEIWWVALFVKLPLYILIMAVGETELIYMVMLVWLILLWPDVCMVGRRFHDIGYNAGIGCALVLINTAIGVYAGAVHSGICRGLNSLIGFCLLLVSVAESQQHANKYGDVPNVS